MISEAGHLKLTDFGLAKVLRPPDTTTNASALPSPAAAPMTGQHGQAGVVAAGRSGASTPSAISSSSVMSTATATAGAAIGGGGGGGGSTASAVGGTGGPGAPPPWSDSYSDIVPLMQRLMPQRSLSLTGGTAGGAGAGADTSGSLGGSFCQPFRVLVVEDEPFTRLITKAMLKSMGFHPVTAPNGKKALEVLRGSLRSNAPVELVLLDLELPVMTGPEVLAEMQVGV
jgi:CheY-like chemotaxis protein